MDKPAIHHAIVHEIYTAHVVCRACGWSTDLVNLRTVVEKLWNEAKKPAKRR